MGSPKKNIAHFIVQSHGIFYFSTFNIHYTGKRQYNKIQTIIENTINLFYKTDDSSSFTEIDDYYGVYSDIFYLLDLNKNKKICNLTFNMKNTDKMLKLYGTIDLSYIKGYYDEYDKYLFKILKENGLINDYYITFLYDEYKFDFNDFNTNYNNILGNLVLGDSPHQFNPGKYKKEDETKINGEFKLNINEMKFGKNTSNYSEKDFRMNFKFNSEFIRGSLGFKNETDKIFFEKLISQNLCRIDNVKENIVISEDLIYSCENNQIMQEKIKEFPTIYFIIREYNLVFFLITKNYLNCLTIVYIF